MMRSIRSLLLLLAVAAFPILAHAQFSVQLIDESHSNVTSYRAGDEIHILVSDYYKFGTVSVTITSETETTSETVVLTESSEMFGFFYGSIPTSLDSPVDHDGILQVSWGDRIHVSYSTIDFEANPVMFSDEALVAGTLRSGVYGSSETWTLEGSPYVLTGDVVYSEGTVLTIEPGVSVLARAGENDQDMFNPLLTLTVFGQLIADGTETDRITFESTSDAAAPNQWGGIRMTGDGSNGSVRWANIRQSSTAVWFGNNWAETTSPVSLVYVNIEHSENGIFVEFAPYAELFIAVVGMSQITNWGIYVDYVPNGAATLIQNTLQSVRNGVYLYSVPFVNFDSNYLVGMDVPDDFSYGLSTGYITTLHVRSNEISKFNYGLSAGADAFTSSNVTLLKNHIHSTRLYGLSLDGVNAVADTNRIENNMGDGIILSTYDDNPVSMEFRHNAIVANGDDGVTLRYNISPLFESNNIHGNGGYDFLVETETGNAVDATGNWWGDATYSEIQSGSNPKNLSAIFDVHDSAFLDEVDYSNWAEAEISLVPYVPTREITFSVDVRFAESMGLYQPGIGDQLYLRGSFNDWAAGADPMTPVSESVYERTVAVAGAEGSAIEYKFYIEAGDGRQIEGFGWETVPGSGDQGNRVHVLGPDQVPEILPTVYFDNRLPVPDLAAPANEATSVALDAVLTWYPVAGITGYTVLLDTVASFTEPLYVQSLSDTFAVPGSVLELGTTYYWVVRSDFDGLESAWSPTWSFQTTGSVTPIAFPVTVEEPDIIWADHILNFDGGVLTKDANPFKTGLNTSDHVLKMVKNVGQVWGGAYFSMSAPIDFSTSTTISLLVWSPRADAKLLFKVENQIDPWIFYETEQTVGVANEWTEMIFDLSAIDTGNEYSKVVLIFDLGTVGDGSSDFTFYLDDIRQIEEELLYTVGAGVTDIDGNEYPSVIIGNQEWMASNLKTTRYANGDPIPNVTDATAWSGLSTGAWVNYDNDPANDATYGKLYNWFSVADERNVCPVGWSVPTHAQRETLTSFLGNLAGQLLKSNTGWFNDGNGSNGSGFDALPSGLRAGVDGSFVDLTMTGFLWMADRTDDETSKYLSLGYNTDSYGHGDLSQLNGFSVRCIKDEIQEIVSPITFPVTAEESDIAWGDFIVNFDGGQLTREVNPYKTGFNTSDHVLKMVKNSGQIWGGSYFPMNAPIDVSSMTKFKLWVWSPRADAKLLFKVEHAADSGIFYELEQTIGVANAWTELLFDLSAINTSQSYTKLVLIFDLGIVGDGSSDFTFYVDEIRQVGDELVLHLPFSTQFDDSTANGLDATSVNAEFMTDRHGVSGYAGYLNGSNAYLTVPDSPAYPDQEITISFWFRRVVPSGILETYLSKEFAFRTSMTDENRFITGFWTGEGGTWSAYETPVLSLSSERWHHYAFTFSNASGMARSYVNGSLVAEYHETDPTNFLKTSPEPLFIGRSGNSDADHVDGGIDEVRIHNRALSAAEIVRIHDLDLDLDGVTVYPGDVNRDLTVDARDLLNIGLYYGESGPSSQAAGQSWARYRRAAWPSDAGTPRRVHADANGDGYIDSQDIIPIGLNYGLESAQAGVAKAVHAVAADSVLVYADLAPTGSGNWMIRFVQADASALYAVSALLDFARLDAFVGQPTLITTHTTLDPHLTFKRWLDNEDVFDVTVTRTDRQTVNSQGTLFEVGLPRSVSPEQASKTRIARFTAVNAAGISVPVRIEMRGGSTTSAPESVDRPMSTTLLQNYPNPFNPVTMLRWTLAESSHVRLQVFDPLGRLVSTVVEGTYPVGTHSTPFDAASYGVSSGMYLYVLTVQNQSSNAIQHYHRKMVLIK